ncbi:MAG: ClcB-like voltage-gated chloride channel protein [Verrucomicrobiae bacterium]|nr:ClcB-like voltage-gated chloride channel protein [Verrucomicrobiae bacterium]
MDKNRAAGRARALLKRHWRRALRLRQKLQPSEQAIHLLLAGFVGVIGGLANLAYYYGVESVKLLFMHRTGDPVEVAEMLTPSLRILFPTLGGLLAGLVLHFGLRLAGPHRPTNLLEVVVAGDGRLPLRSGLVKTLSALISIGTGASIGREGGVVQLAATLASKAGQLLGYQPYRLRLLVGCGAAAGIAAAYNAPISGAVFAAMIVLGSFSMNLFAPLVFASVIAAVLTRSFFGIRPWYVVPEFDFTSLSQLPWFVLLGLVAGALGALFLELLNLSEARFNRLGAPVYARLAVAGLIVGLIAVWYPGVWGNGYVITNRILHNEFGDEPYPLLFLTGLFCAKLLATAATVGAGTVGGVFTPTLFLGASMGSAFGMAVHQLGQAEQLPTAVFALVGMAATLSATTHSPLLAMVMVFEITLNYSLMPALMLASVVSVLVSRRLHGASIYTESLRAKGIEVEHEVLGHPDPAALKVGDLMRAPVPPVYEKTKLSEIAARFLASTNNFLPVVNEKQQLVGVVALQDLKAHLTEQDDMGVIAYDVMRPPAVCVTPNQPLTDVLAQVLASEQRHIPVVNNLVENRLIGSISRDEVLAIFSEALSPRGERVGRRGSS